MFRITNIAVIIFVAFVVNLIVFMISWRRRNSKSGFYFLLGMLGVVIWSFASALDYAAVPLSLKIFFAKVEALGYLSGFALIARACIAIARLNLIFDIMHTEYRVFFVTHLRESKTP